MRHRTPHHVYSRTLVLAAGLSLGLPLMTACGAKRRRAGAGQDRLCDLPHRTGGRTVRHSRSQRRRDPGRSAQCRKSAGAVQSGRARRRQDRAKFVDEAGSAADIVTQYRNLVERDHVDVVVGYVSSGNCLAITPVAEELKQLTVLDICGTPRIFEEKPRHYVFRVNPHATMDNVAAAKYVLGKIQEPLRLFRHQSELRLGTGIPGAISAWR